MKKKAVAFAVTTRCLVCGEPILDDEPCYGKGIGVWHERCNDKMKPVEEGYTCVVCGSKGNKLEPGQVATVCNTCAGIPAYRAVISKVTAGKPKLAFTFRSTMEAIAAVREYATNGPYKDPNNWKEVADADWDESLLRHVMAYLEAKKGNGSVYDKDSSLHHIAHVLTIAGFIIENLVTRDHGTIKEEKK